jgi:hypothetical protein
MYPLELHQISAPGLIPYIKQLGTNNLERTYEYN